MGTLKDVKDMVPAVKGGMDIQFDGTIVPNNIMREMPVSVAVEWFDCASDVWDVKDESSN